MPVPPGEELLLFTTALMVDIRPTAERTASAYCSDRRAVGLPCGARRGGPLPVDGCAEQGDVPMLRMSGITKRFVGIQALTNVTFEARAGEVHAIVGENGAGKSTLMKILSGVYEPDGGSIEIDGRLSTSPALNHSQRLGVAMVYQEFDLVPELNVAENILLGRQPVNQLGF